MIGIGDVEGGGQEYGEEGGEYGGYVAWISLHSTLDTGSLDSLGSWLTVKKLSPGPNTKLGLIIVAEGLCCSIDFSIANFVRALSKRNQIS